MPLRRTLELTASQCQELIEHRDHDPHPYVRERCAAILKIADGQSAHAVACHGLLKPRDPDTVYSWLNHYEQAGLDGLLGYQQGGPRRRGL
jgi:transposase